MRGSGVEYFAASVDDPDTNAKFARSQKLDFPVLSDPAKTTARAYGVLSASGMASRATAYIGKDGRIVDIDRNVNVRSHGDDIAARLGELKL